MTRRARAVGGDDDDCEIKHCEARGEEFTKHHRKSFEDAQLHIHCRFGKRALYVFFCVSVMNIIYQYKYQHQYDAIVISE